MVLYLICVVRHARLSQAIIKWWLHNSRAVRIPLGAHRYFILVLRHGNVPGIHLPHPPCVRVNKCGLQSQPFAPGQHQASKNALGVG